MTTPPASADPDVPPPGDGGEPPEPPASAKPKKSRRRRIIKWTSLSLVSLLIIVAGGIAFDAWWIDRKITKVPVAVPTGKPGDKVRPTAAPDATHAENFVLIGSDTRSGANGKGTGGGDVAGARSDTTIVLHIAADNKGATLISIPRDSYVNIPPCVIGPNNEQSEPITGTKFNTAFSIGAEHDVKLGGSCTVLTIEDLTGVPMNHYAVIDFSGFEKMVDALGGVNVCVAKPLVDPKVHNASGYHGTNLNLQPGKSVHINGHTALKLMRARYGIDGGGDLPRIKRQQVFMAAMIRKATSTGLLTHPLELQHFLSATASSLTTDGFGLGTMKKLASALHSEGAGAIRLLTVPNYAPGPTSPLYGDVVWQQPQADNLWNAIKHDQPIPGVGKGPALTVSPSDISVAVENGTTIKHEANTVATQLRAQGYNVVSTGKAKSRDLTDTTINYGPTKVQSSQTLAKAIPGATTQADPKAGTTLTLIVGSNFSKVNAVTIGAGNHISSVDAGKASCLR